MTNELSINQLAKIIKPVRGINYLELCANYLKEIQFCFSTGDESYEIGAENTKNGHPFVINKKP